MVCIKKPQAALAAHTPAEIHQKIKKKSNGNGNLLNPDNWSFFLAIICRSRKQLFAERAPSP